MNQPTEEIHSSDFSEIVQLSRAWADRRPDRILLDNSDIPPEIRRQIALQVDLLPKMKQKLPRFALRGGYIPARVNFEQCSGEEAADYKRQFIAPHGETLCDLTGGLGIDFLALASMADQATVYELMPTTAEALRYNLSQLLPLPSHHTVLCADGQATLLSSSTPLPYTFIYSDPARRDMHTQSRRVVSMLDYSPDPLQLVHYLEQTCYTGRLLIKLSPMLDIHRLIEQFPRINELHLLQVGDEVKEILLFFDFARPSSPTITATHLHRGETLFSWSYDYTDERSARSSYATAVGSYVYLPAPVIMKSGAFHLLTRQTGLQLLAANSHLFTSDQRVDDFPGKGYQLVEAVPYSKHGRKLLQSSYPALSIMTRNFPLSAQDLKKQLKTKENDHHLLLATTDSDQRRLLLILKPLTDQSHPIH